MSNIVVTLGANAAQKEALTGVLGRLANVVFIDGLPAGARLKQLAEADVLISWSPGRELTSEECKLITRAKLMQLLSAGADQVPYSRLPPSLTISSNAGAYAEPMAEHVLAMILAATKNLWDRQEKLKQGIFYQSHENRMLRGSACAVLGFGGIGRATARLLQCFGVKIYAINTTGKTSEHVEFIGAMKDLEHVLRLADIVLISLPLTKHTRGLIGNRELSWMRNDAILVNVARAQIIDEEALYEKLKACPDFIAAIDAWWTEPASHGEFLTNYPFLELPNVLGSPHNSGIAHGSFLNATKHAAENVKRFLNGEPIVGIVSRTDYE